ncbi:MAG: glucokinase [Chromatiales bacterium]|jgi:glucokinase
MKVIAGDIGGTKTLLSIFEWQEGRLVAGPERTYPSADYPDLDTILAEFLGSRGGGGMRAAFGVAGPVRGRAVRTTNLPWVIDADALERRLGLGAVRLLNDLEATAHGVLTLDDQAFRVLNPGEPQARGNRAVIAAGTGLGEAGMVWDGSGYRPFPTEGGHAGYGPEDAVERALLAFMAGRYGRVTWERVLSGSALPDLLGFVEEHEGEPADPGLRTEMQSGDAGAAITRAASEGRCPVCVRAVDLFARLYGSEAGNLGLRMLATGGIYIGGGIAPKIVDTLARGPFLEAFRSKPPMEGLLAAMPLKVVMESRAALLGAARVASLG